MTEKDRLYMDKRIEDIMDAAEPTDTQRCGYSIYIHTPSDSRIACRDFIEVNIHLHGANRKHETQEEAGSAAEVRICGDSAVAEEAGNRFSVSRS